MYVGNDVVLIPGYLRTISKLKLGLGGTFMLCGSFVTMVLSFLRKRKEKRCSFDVRHCTELAAWTTDMKLL